MKRDAVDTIPETSYVTLLASALPMRIPPGHPGKPSKTVAELASDGVIAISGLDEIAIAEKEGKATLDYIGQK
jgi:hypothetical protein